MFRNILKHQFLVLATALGIILGATTAQAQAPKKAPDPKAKAKKYEFTLESFQILNTRSLHNDTDHVSFALKVGNKVYPAKVKHMGDVNNGTHKVNLSFKDVEIPKEDTKIVLTYLIMNNGHSQDKVSAWLKKGAEALLSKGAEAVGGPWGVVVGIVGDLGLNILFANCDGWVAGDCIQLTGREVEGWGQSHRVTRNYPGMDSPTGCGSNSDYRVTWSVKRQ